MPSVSICIPVYNGGKTIGRTIESILDQSYRDFELVIIENACTDDTLAVIKRFDDSRIRIVSNPETVDVVQNWTLAIANTTGEFVKLVCADDLIHKTCVEEEVAVFQNPANARVVLVAAQRTLIDEHDGVIRARHGLGGFDSRVDGGKAIRRSVRSGTNPIGEPAAVLMRGDQVRAQGSWHGGWMIDLDMWSRLLQHGDLFAIKKPLASFRVFATSWSTSLVKTQRRDAVIAYRTMQERQPDLVTNTDIAIGNVRAWLLNQVRRAVYWNLARKNK